MAKREPCILIPFSTLFRQISEVFPRPAYAAFIGASALSISSHLLPLQGTAQQWEGMELCISFLQDPHTAWCRHPVCLALCAAYRCSPCPLFQLCWQHHNTELVPELWNSSGGWGPWPDWCLQLGWQGHKMERYEWREREYRRWRRRTNASRMRWGRKIRQQKKDYLRREGDVRVEESRIAVGERN